MHNPSNKTAAIALILSLAISHVAFAETTGQYIDDSTITTKVKAAFLADSQLKAMQIKVQTTHGIVQLSGAVDTKVEESQAIKVANTVEGVKSVNDTMTVKGTEQQ